MRRLRAAVGWRLEVSPAVAAKTPHWSGAVSDFDGCLSDGCVVVVARRCVARRRVAWKVAQEAAAEVAAGVAWEPSGYCSVDQGVGRHAEMWGFERNRSCSKRKLIFPRRSTFPAKIPSMVDRFRRWGRLSGSLGTLRIAVPLHSSTNN